MRTVRTDPHTRDLPVIMLTARSAEQDAVTALDSGADDYIVKPFSPREMISRIQAVLRRRAPHLVTDAITIGGLRIDPSTHRVTATGQEVTLSPTEFRLLHVLMAQPGRVQNRSQLLDKVWDMNSYREERTVDAYVGRLRSALEAVGYHTSIETVRGLGYRFVAPARAIQPSA